MSIFKLECLLSETHQSIKMTRVNFVGAPMGTDFLGGSMESVPSLLKVLLSYSDIGVRKGIMQCNQYSEERF